VWLHLPHPLRASPDLCTRHNTLLGFGMRVSSFLTYHVFIHKVFLMSHVFINEFSSSPSILLAPVIYVHHICVCVQDTTLYWGLSVRVSSFFMYHILFTKFCLLRRSFMTSMVYTHPIYICVEYMILCLGLGVRVLSFLRSCVFSLSFSNVLYFYS
jgi:hypothetical protein